MSVIQKKSSGITTVVPDATHRSKTRELSDIPARARKLAAEAIGIDSHIDTVQSVLVMGADLGKRRNVGHVDIPRLHEGGTHARFFALWVPVYFPGSEAVRRTLDLRDAMQSLFDTHKDQIEHATTAADIERIVICRGRAHDRRRSARAANVLPVGDTVDASDAFAQQQLGGFRDRRAGPQRA